MEQQHEHIFHFGETVQYAPISETSEYKEFFIDSSRRVTIQDMPRGEDERKLWQAVLKFMKQQHTR